MHHAPAVQIDLTALRHNLDRVHAEAPDAKIMAVIKANAYGHGMLKIAEALSGVDALAVARIDEAMQLRQSGIRNPIVILAGCFTANGLQLAAENDLQLVVHQQGQIDLLSSVKLPRGIDCWLKIDTGMNRLGFPVDQAAGAYQELLQLDVVNSVNIMSHLANADLLDDDKTDQQLAQFQTLIEHLDVETSIANSAAILGWPESHHDWVRPGLMLYGVSPLAGQTAQGLDLQPVMTLTASLIGINHCRAGDAVGYGGAWRCPEDMPVGVVGIGYGDGYPRHAKEGTPLLLHGRRVALIGPVSMDSLTVDLREVPDAQVGDQVTLWGDALPVELIAEAADTISYALMTGIADRVSRGYLSAQEAVDG